jgi:predicted O-methyltransferase YrrM
LTKPLVALMQPRAGLRAPRADAIEAFLRPTKRGTDRVELKQGTSMLPRCFNMLWAEMRTLHRRGYAFTHVAMIHDDVCPEEGWLDTLMDELDRTGADMVSAVVPIKNHHGVTSTAVDQPDPWLVRRLTLREAFDLPETFFAEDVPWREPGQCLLTNTGLWVARYDPAWVDRTCFRFLNRIVEAPDGALVSHDQPEDWIFAREFAGWGFRAAATRKVKLEHESPLFHNRSPWGDWPIDVGWASYNRAWERAASGAAAPGWRFPADIAGWLGREEGEYLAQLAAGKRVLEVGSYCGRSTVCMAQAAVSLAAVDPFTGDRTEDVRDTLGEFTQNVIRYDVAEKVTTLRGVSADVLPRLRRDGAEFDLVFIDGAHDRASVELDLELSLPLLAEGGVLAFHDYRESEGDYDGRWDPDVTAVVSELIASGAEVVGRAGTVIALAGVPSMAGV